MPFTYHDDANADNHLMEQHERIQENLGFPSNKPSLLTRMWFEAWTGEISRTPPATFSYPAVPTGPTVEVPTGVTHWWLFIINNIIIVMILVGNLMTLFLIIRYKKLQTVTYSFVISLACADLLMGLVYPVYNTINYTTLVQDNQLHLPCSLSLYFIVVSAGVSNLGLMVISVDRYIAVVHPLRYHMKMTKRRANISIVVIWTYMVLASLSMFSVYAHDTQTYYHSSCSLLNVIPEWYFFCIILPHMLVPNIISKCLYWRIVRVAHSLEAKTHEGRLGLGSSRAKKEYRAAKMMAVLLILFLLCWAPYTILHVVIYIIGTDSPQGLYTALEIAKVFSVSNSCINPFIYTWKSPGFRKALKLFWGCKPTGEAEVLVTHVGTARSDRSSSIESIRSVTSKCRTET